MLALAQSRYAHTTKYSTISASSISAYAYEVSVSADPAVGKVQKYTWIQTEAKARKWKRISSNYHEGDWEAELWARSFLFSRSYCSVKKDGQCGRTCTIRQDIEAVWKGAENKVEEEAPDDWADVYCSCETNAPVVSLGSQVSQAQTKESHFFQCKRLYTRIRLDQWYSM